MLSRILREEEREGEGVGFLVNRHYGQNAEAARGSFLMFYSCTR